MPDSQYDEPYESGEYLEHWDYRWPTQELVAIAAAGVIPRDAVALDVGCGAGREAIFLRQLGCRAVGLDRSGAALRIAQERARTENVQVYWVQADARTIPLASGVVGFANDRGLFHLIKEVDRPAVAAELARVLKPGARLLLRGCRESAIDGLDASAEGQHADEQEIFVPVTEEQLRKYLEPAGFRFDAVLPIEMVSDAGTLPGNVVLLTRR